MNQRQLDERWMKRALHLAKKGIGFTSPNPRVGCVVVKNGRAVGEGWHRGAGTPHAEVLALDAAGGGARGAVLYVTLEPCAHFGRTPPCAPRLVESGVRRVVAALLDPDPRVAGKGFRILEKAGVETVRGVLEAEARAINQPFLKRALTGLPYVVVKGAVSLDGKTAAGSGESKWITSEASRRDAHRLRREADAVLVGIGTALADDPQLTARLPGRKKTPLRVVLDGTLRLPVEGRLARLGAEDGKTLAFHRPGASARRKRALENAGVRTVEIPEDPRGRIDLAAALRFLAERGALSVLVEGGGTATGSFLRSGHADRAVLYQAPALIGGDARGFWEGTGAERLSEALRPLEIRRRRIGEDWKIDCLLKRY